MVALLPATATVIGIVVLAQIPSARQVLGVVLVVAAVAIHRDRIAAEASAAPETSAPSGRARTSADVAAAG